MIFIPRDGIRLTPLGNGVCVKIMFKGYEISIALDDSCAALPNLSRGDLRVYQGEQDLTSRFFEGEGASGDLLYSVMQKIAAAEDEVRNSE